MKVSAIKTTKRKAYLANKEKGKGNQYKKVARKGDPVELWWLNVREPMHIGTYYLYY